MDPLTRLLVAFMCVLTSSVGIANALAKTAPAQGVTTVTLRATVRLATDAELTLGSIASIEGDQTGFLDTLPITDADAVMPGSWSKLSAETVRAAIEASSAHVGSIIVVGQGVSLTRLRERTTPIARTAPEPADDPSVITVRDHVESWLRARFRASPETLRVTYTDQSRELLGTPTDGRMVSVTETGLSGRIALRIEVFEGDYLVLTDSVRASIEVLTDALIVAKGVRRGSPLRESDVRRETAWTDPTDPPAPPATSVGQALVRSLQPGQIVREHHLEAPIMIERGQDVSVRTVHGSVVVSTVARARQNARKGELIELESKDGSRRRFTARVAGPGRAVMANTPQPERVSAELGTELVGEPGSTNRDANPSRRISISEPPAGDAPDMRPINQNAPTMQPVRKTK